MANININSYNQILGAMIRKMIADTPVNDINKGSVILTLLEAAAANDFENNTSILNVLELLNIDTLRNADLDAYASNFGLTRRVATKASGVVKIIDTAITKRATTLSSIKTAPIAGTNKLYVNDASQWAQFGKLFIGRGTTNYEGPLSYVSVENNGSFYTITLSESLKKDHLLSDVVIDSQGTSDRRVPAGTIVSIPANNINPEISYSLLKDAIIPSGEDSVNSVAVIALTAGSVSNAGINTITKINSILSQFATASVSNTIAFTNGTDAESDETFKNRIKAYSSSLARGTWRAIYSAIDGLSDTDEGKQVMSAYVSEPVNSGEPSIVYIDDGNGLDPSYSGQSVDLLLNSSDGNEQFFQLSNYPITRPQVLSNGESPFLLLDGMQLKVLVDGIEESIDFNAGDFSNLSNVDIEDLISVINSKSSSFKARLHLDKENNNFNKILIYPTDYSAETLQISSDGELLDANTQLKFATNEFSYISLYKNNVRLKQKQKSAFIISKPISSWGVVQSGNIVLSVDNTPNQDKSFASSDFDGKSFNDLTIHDWVSAFNNKFAGITAAASITGRLILSSNKDGALSSIEITSGSYMESMFDKSSRSAVGQDSDFSINRQNGNLQLNKNLSIGDSISAGSYDTKGSIISTPSSNGFYNLSVDSNGRPAELVIVVDANKVSPRVVGLIIGSSITVSNEGNNVMRISCDSLSAFKNIQINDFIYIANRQGSATWLDTAYCGLFKVSAKGEHTALTPTNTAYIEVINVGMEANFSNTFTIQDTADIQAFYSDAYPQLWKASSLITPDVAPILDVATSINASIKGVSAKVIKSNIKITSITETNGSIAIPVRSGSASALFTNGKTEQIGSPSHIANKIQNKDMLTVFESTTPDNTNIWLDRYIYTDIKRKVISEFEPIKDGTLSYSEIINDSTTIAANYNDSVVITSGQNKGQTRGIRTIVDNDQDSIHYIETRNDKPRSILDYNINDEYSVAKNLEFSSEDKVFVIVDNDATNKTIDIPLSRKGQVNSGSQQLVFMPGTREFSANDSENETGIDFGSLRVWGKLPSQCNTDFSDYAIWFKARNWYYSNNASMVIRSSEFGPIGDKTTFGIVYPTSANQSVKFDYVSSYNEVACAYTFGSDNNIQTDVITGDKFTITSLGNDMFNMRFPSTATTSNIGIGSVVSILPSSGWSLSNTGQFRINSKSDIDRTITIYNPNGVATISGSIETQSIKVLADTSDSLNNKFFIVTAPDGKTIKFWLDNGDVSNIEPQIGLTDRSHKVSITTNDSAITIATAIVTMMGTDISIGVVSNNNGASDTIIFSFVDNGACILAHDGSNPTNFTFNLVTAGVSDTFETLQDVSGLQIFNLLGTSTQDVAASINSSKVLEAAIISNGTFIRSTKDEFAVSQDELAYGHMVTARKISLYDSTNWILTFKNTNPNFTLKNDLILVNKSPIVNGLRLYNMNTCPNVNDSSLGEYFKLIPTTARNIEHHLTQKALSQLHIISDISLSNNNKRLQLKSKLLGSSGAIEVIGGMANNASFKIIGDSEKIAGTDFMSVKIASTPSTFSPGQHVLLSNDSGVERAIRFNISDTMDVVRVNSDTFRYTNNMKNTDFNSSTSFTIVDANSIDPQSYPNPGIIWRWSHDGAINALDKVQQGDLVVASGTLSDWANSNKILSSGLEEVGGFPIVKVDSANKFFDVVNPFGKAMSSTVIGANSLVGVISTSIIEWKLAHSSKVAISTVSVSSGIALAYTSEPHKLNIGDTFIMADNMSGVAPAVPGNNVGTVISVEWPNKFTYATSASDAENLSQAGFIIKTSKSITRYKIESLGYNDLFRLTASDGDSPKFVSCGVAVDDILVISGNTFSNNSGKFRILAVDEDSILYVNPNGTEELNTLIKFNNYSMNVNWVSNSNTVTGLAGSFSNIKIGDWVKKITDDDSQFRQVIATNSTDPYQVTSLTLGSVYDGITATDQGHCLDQNSSVNTGLYLQSTSDIKIYEGDSVQTNDTLFISESTDQNWFKAVNSGSYSIANWGTSADGRLFLEVNNPSGIAQSNVSRSLTNNSTRLSIIEGSDNKMQTIKKIHHVAIDEANPDRRIVYLTPGNRTYKWSQSNTTSITAIGRLNYSNDIVMGVDGYQYYTGILRKVQRTIDGFEPDAASFPGRKAVGSMIEVMPPLKRKVSISIDVTTKDGVNVSEISNEISSTVINYVNDLGVGQDVILSDIIVRVKRIEGVVAVTFKVPTASTERISILANEKPHISPSDITIG